MDVFNEPLYDFDQIFVKWKDRTFFSDVLHRKIVREYPKLDQILDTYEAKLSSAPKSFAPANPRIYGHELNLTNIGFMRIFWDIDVATSFLAHSNLQQYGFPVSKLVPLVQEKDICYKHLATITIQTHPVIVAKCTLVPEQYIILDGNHTVLKLHQLNPQTLVRSYFVSEKDHMSFMCDDVFRLLYKIQYNLQQIANYMLGANAAVLMSV